MQHSAAGWIWGAHLAQHGGLHTTLQCRSTAGHSPHPSLTDVPSQVYEGTLTDAMPDLYAEHLRRHGALPRFSPLVLGAATPDAPRPDQVVLSDAVLGANCSRAAYLAYLHAPGTADAIKGASHWLVLDPQRGAALLQSAAAYLLTPAAARSRLALLLSPAGGDSATSALARVLLAASSLTSRLHKLPPFLLALSGDEALWARLAASEGGAAEAAVAAAEAAGLNGAALRLSLIHI